MSKQFSTSCSLQSQKRAQAPTVSDYLQTIVDWFLRIEFVYA